MDTMTLLDLNSDVLLLIFSKLSISDLRNIAQSCGKLKDIIYSFKSLWRYSIATFTICEMDATVAASIYQRGIEAIESPTLIISQLSNIGASTTDIVGPVFPPRLSPALRYLIVHDDATTAVVKCKPFNCQTWIGVVSKEIPKMLKPSVNLETLYIYMHCEFDEESIQAHNFIAIRQEVTKDELECWPSKLQDLEVICNVNPMGFVPVGNLKQLRRLALTVPCDRRVARYVGGHFFLTDCYVPQYNICLTSSHSLWQIDHLQHLELYIGKVQYATLDSTKFQTMKFRGLQTLRLIGSDIWLRFDHVLDIASCCPLLQALDISSSWLCQMSRSHLSRIETVFKNLKLLNLSGHVLLPSAEIMMCELGRCLPKLEILSLIGCEGLMPLMKDSEELRESLYASQTKNREEESGLKSLLGVYDMRLDEPWINSTKIKYITGSENGAILKRMGRESEMENEISWCSVQKDSSDWHEANGSNYFQYKGSIGVLDLLKNNTP